MNKTINIRKAAFGDAATLSDLAIRSKAFWGYSPEFMEACVDELSVTHDDIDNSHFHYLVAELGSELVGFYNLEEQDAGEIELGALFVDPAHIGMGIGKALIENAKKCALKLGAKNLFIQGDPNAEKFYRAAGGILTGSKESKSIAGRFLPTFRIPLVKEGTA